MGQGYNPMEGDVSSGISWAWTQAPDDPGHTLDPHAQTSSYRSTWTLFTVQSFASQSHASTYLPCRIFSSNAKNSNHVSNNEIGLITSLNLTTRLHRINIKKDSRIPLNLIEESETNDLNLVITFPSTLELNLLLRSSYSQLRTFLRKKSTINWRGLCGVMKN